MVPEFTKDDAGKTRFDLVPPLALKAISDVLTYGAHNWCQNADWSRYISALDRHLNAWKAGRGS